MRMVDLILKKRSGQALTEEEIEYFVSGYTKGDIPDYQVSALLMAICFQHMNEQETAALTKYMVESGECVDLSPIEGIKVDKHSTGGVGDKTTLALIPILAACGLKVAKMSGRGLGHTGGTIDKLESIPGFRTAMEKEEFFRIVQKTGLCVIGQTGNLVPADKKLYALRDVTGTVEEISLIASSIMSKKIAGGADAILLDVKTGSGAFMKTKEDAIQLAHEMVKIGVNMDRKVMAVITNMDQPLGNAIGNSLEMVEAIHTLLGKGPADFTLLCTELAVNILCTAKGDSEEQARKEVDQALQTGAAFAKLLEMVQSQGGDVSYLENPEKFPKAKEYAVYSKTSGYIRHMDAQAFGRVSTILGAGRLTKTSEIDHAAGLILHAKCGDFVEKGQLLATLYTNAPDAVDEAEKTCLAATEIGEQKPEGRRLILARVTPSGVEEFR